MRTHQANKREITRLSRFWYEYVSDDHHKDCDCHWYITKVWSYGNKPKYIAQHFGYIFDGGEIVCGSLQEAHKALLNLLKQAIDREKEWGKQVMDNQKEYDSYQISKAEKILKFI